MKRIQIYAIAIVAALIPAGMGLWGNVSFSQDLPVRVPAEAKTPPDAPTATPMPNPTATPTGDDGDRDRGRGRDHPEDSLTHGPTEAGDDHGRRHGGHGSDDSAGDDRGSDDSGTGNDDTGGSRGHGSDD